MPVRHRGNELSEPKFGWMLYQERRLAAAFDFSIRAAYSACLRRSGSINRRCFIWHFDRIKVNLMAVPDYADQC